MKALIAVNGDPPPRALLLRRAEESGYIIAADGGYKLLAGAGIEPDLLVGDFDSLSREELKDGIEVLEVPEEKNDTDAFLAVEQAIARGANEIIMLGATGGRIDHLLSNLMLVKWAHEKGARLTIEDAVQSLEIGSGDFAISGEPGQTVSIIPVDDTAVVTASGLYYPLEELVLRNDRPRGVSNVFSGAEARIFSREPVFIIKIKL